MPDALQSFIPNIKTEPEALHAAFDVVFSERSQVDELYRLWRDFFADNQGNYARISGYPHHWELFVRLTWDIFLRLPENEVFAHLKWQVPTAFRLNLPVEDQVFFFLYRRYVGEKEIEVAYRSMRQEILESPVPINPGKSGSLPLRDLIKQRSAVVRKDVGLDDSATLARIEQELFANAPLHAVTEEVDKVAITRSFLSFVDFLRKNEAITNILVDVMYKRQEAALNFSDEALQNSPPLKTPEKKSEGNSMPEVSGESKNRSSRREEKEVQSPVLPIPPTPKMPEITEHISYVHIQELIDERFSKDEKGEYEDVDAVLAMLSTLAMEYGDEKIGELYYFDEGAERFQWNADLIKE